MPNESAAPASDGFAAVTSDNQLATGAIGVFRPIPPASMPPGGTDPGPSRAAPTASTTAPLNVCRPGAASPPPAPPPEWRAHNYKLTIYPALTRNAAGGYDAKDPAYDYYSPNAVPPGGDPSQTQLGAPATANNIAGHIVAVPVSSAGIPTADGGQCSVGDYTFGHPYLAGDNPPPPPAPDVMDTPPFPLGESLLAAVMSHWRIGSIGTLPGPGDTTRTFVHIPTCAWLDTSVPSDPVQLHAVKTAQSNGYTLFLVYTVTVTPGTVTWDWGDGRQTTSLDAPTTPPPTLPVYDASTQTWSNPCSVSHDYATVSQQGRTITATQAFTTAITVRWSDGVSVHQRSVACDHATGGPCTSTIGPAQGWRSGPHPVDQIEPVPFNPKAPA